VPRGPWVRLAALAALFVAGCVTPPPSHSCVGIWGDQADQLTVLLNDARAANDPGWARRVVPQDLFDNLVSLENAVAQALGEGAAPQPWTGAPPLPGMDSLGVLASGIRTGLEMDRGSGFHPDPATPGWLRRPSPTTPGVAKAQALLAALREAVDM
jgi:hypothetical protein